MDYDKILEKLEEISIELESYNDYPQSATNNANVQESGKKKMVVIVELELAGLDQHN